MLLRRHERGNVTKLNNVSPKPKVVEKSKEVKKEVKSNATTKTKKASGKSK